jgi:SAM-dependent methyltransferase
MAMLYRSEYAKRYEQIAELIGTGSTVLDLCCGPGILYRRHLQQKSVDYLGMDLHPGFIKNLTRCGARGEVRDLRGNDPLPLADYVVMQSSLYHFLPNPRPVIDRMLAAATKATIIAEPVHNLASSRIPLVRRIASSLTNPGSGMQRSRFTEEMLENLVNELSTTFHISRISAGRERLYVFTKA